MRTERPPRVATWLLRRFGVSISVIGDLVEQNAAGRSNFWFIRQALGAVVVRVLDDVRTHKGTAIRALALGWTCQWLLLAMLRSPVRAFLGWTGVPVWNWTVENSFDVLRAVWFGRSGFSLPVLATVASVCVLTGWIVGRLHQSQRASMVAVFASSTPIFGALWFHAESTVGHVSSAFLLIALPACALLGGIGGAAISDSA